MKSIFSLILIILLLSPSTSLVLAEDNDLTLPIKYNIEIYNVSTIDQSSITLTRYVGTKRPSIILIHGMGANHLMFDWDENHSLARFLNNDDWDVWMLDLRTHDGDGDFFFVKGSDREYINRYWDFDNTYLKIDVVTAVDFVKEKTGFNRIFLSGQSYGGYLAYAYAELIGEDDLAGIITTGASPYANPKGFQPLLLYMYKFGFYFGKKAFVRCLGHPYSFSTKNKINNIYEQWEKYKKYLFYENTTPAYIQMNIGYHGDSEPAGVVVDMDFGKDLRKYSGHWVDPQTLYDYSENLDKINIPVLFIAGENDLQDPRTDIYKALENVSSEIKEFHSFPNHAHLDLLLGDDASTLIFPIITDWLNLRISSK